MMFLGKSKKQNIVVTKVNKKNITRTDLFTRQNLKAILKMRLYLPTLAEKT